MKLYYKVVTNEGKSIDGLIEARDQNEAVAYLHSKGLIPIKIEKREESKLKKLIPFFGGKIKEVVFFLYVCVVLDLAEIGKFLIILNREFHISAKYIENPIFLLHCEYFLKVGRSEI